MKIPAHVPLPPLSRPAGYFSVLAVVLRTDNESPWTDEFDSKLMNKCTKQSLEFTSCCVINSTFLYSAEVELSCLIDSISTINPRIEWKKIKDGGPSYVYFDRKVSGNVHNAQTSQVHRESRFIHD